MHPTKIAAILALVVALIAAGYLSVVLYQNVIQHKAELAAVESIQHGTDFEDNSTGQYLISGGIAVVALIASLALFGAAKDRE